MLLEQLQKILDFPYHSDLAYEEARKKLMGTWMLVNGELTYISDINQTTLCTTKGPIPETSINTLEVFMPQPGTYLTKDKQGIVTVKKRAGKQWRKSFNTDLYFWNDYDPEEIDWNYSKFIEYQGFLYYLGNIVGIIDNGKVLVTKYMFYQEILDESKRTGKWTIFES